MFRLFLITFLSAVATLMFWSHHFQPKHEHTEVPLTSMPSYVQTNVCGGFGYPTRVFRVWSGVDATLYQVSCSNGITVGTSW
jgi:hypothetical protein